jgi:hypothetical protein
VRVSMRHEQHYRKRTLVPGDGAVHRVRVRKVVSDDYLRVRHLIAYEPVLERCHCLHHLRAWARTYVRGYRTKERKTKKL